MVCEVLVGAFKGRPSECELKRLKHLSALRMCVCVLCDRGPGSFVHHYASVAKPMDRAHHSLEQAVTNPDQRRRLCLDAGRRIGEILQFVHSVRCPVMSGVLLHVVSCLSVIVV